MVDLDAIRQHLSTTWLTTDDHRHSTELLRELVEEMSTTLVVHEMCCECGETVIGPWSRRAESLELARSEGWAAGSCPDCADRHRS